MITIQGNLGDEVNVAFSGGIDSVAVVDFLSRTKKVNLIFFNHRNSLANLEEEFVRDFARERELDLIVGYCDRSEKPKELSVEEFWRNCRYDFFKSLDRQIIACHHLDDCVETWLWSCMHGEGRIIPYSHANVIRPFRLTAKDDFVRWCEKNDCNWFHDPSNDETNYIRNYIRHQLMPHALHVNPGLHKVIRKKVAADKY